MLGIDPKIWSRIQLFAVVLIVIGAFAPIQDPLDRIVGGVGAVLSLTCLGIISREERRERRADESSSAAISSGEQT